LGITPNPFHRGHPGYMKERLNMKKKLTLAIIAAILVITLAIGGTLMAFSTNTASVTNVVTLGSFNDDDDDSEPGIKLWEIIDDEDDSSDTTDDETGYVIHEANNDDHILATADVLGHTYTKAPYVTNTSTLDAYVALKGEITITLASDFDWTSITAPALTSIVGDFVSGLTVAGWYRASFSDSVNTANEYIATVIWIYGDSAADLTVLAQDGSTADGGYPFDGVTLPSFGDATDNYFQGAEFSLKLTAYAMQTENTDAQALIALAL